MPLAMYKHNLQLVFNSDDYTGTFKNLTFNDQEDVTRSPYNSFIRSMKVTRYLLYPCLLMAASASAQNAMTSSPYSDVWTG